MSSEAKTLPKLSDEGLTPTHAVKAVDEYGNTRDVHVAGESPLTVKVDGREVVTLMTLGTRPEALGLGYLRNQKLIDDVAQIESVTVNWDVETVFVTTTHGEGIIDWEEKIIPANRYEWVWSGDDFFLHRGQHLQHAPTCGYRASIDAVRTARQYHPA